MRAWQQRNECDSLASSPLDTARDAYAPFLPSMNLRFGLLLCAREKIEIATLIGLADMLGIHGAIAAQEMRRRRFPGGATARQLFLVDVEMDFPCRHVDLDLIAGLHQRQR